MKILYKKLKRFYDAIVTRLYNTSISIIFAGKYDCGRNARFSGIPRILPLAGKITIGNNARLSSRLLSNLLGVNHPVILSTIENGKIQIGNDFHISGGSIISRKLITIGNHVYVGANCLITDSDHHEMDFKRRREGKSSNIRTSKVTIGDDVWIGANVTILKGVTIGDQAIIGAGITVRKDVASGVILGPDK